MPVLGRAVVTQVGCVSRFLTVCIYWKIRARVQAADQVQTNAHRCRPDTDNMHTEPRRRARLKGPAEAAGRVAGSGSWRPV